jgi:hypothetical protein
MQGEKNMAKLKDVMTANFVLLEDIFCPSIWLWVW